MEEESIPEMEEDDVGFSPGIPLPSALAFANCLPFDSYFGTSSCGT